MDNIKQNIAKEIAKVLELDEDTILANIEKPKMKPYIEDMKKNLAAALKIKEEQISIKAKTNEGKDAIGMGELACANVIVLLKSSH
jgi:2-C-methyl-D-erythritol 2,4-cyclodiphosphate synthase